MSALQASVTSMLAEQQQEVRQVQAGARRQDRLAEERLRRAEDQIASMAQARQELDHKVCTSQPCSCDIHLICSGALLQSVFAGSLSACYAHKAALCCAVLCCAALTPCIGASTAQT